MLYIEVKLIIPEPHPYHGLLAGADWRDTMDEKLKNTPLLSNNTWLYELYIAPGEKQKAAQLKNRINEVFWHEGILRDYPVADSEDIYAANYLFDPMGQVRTDEQDIFDVLRRVSNDYPEYDFKKKVRGYKQTNFARWYVVRTLRSIHRAFMEQSSLVASTSLARAPNDLVPYTVSLDGFIPSENPVKFEQALNDFKKM